MPRFSVIMMILGRLDELKCNKLSKMVSGLRVDAKRKEKSEFFLIYIYFDLKVLLYRHSNNRVVIFVKSIAEL